MPDAYKRIYELNPELTLSLTHNIAVDKNGNVSATKVLLSEIVALLKIPNILTVNDANHTILDNDGYDVILMNPTSADRTVFLPTVADNLGRTPEIINISSTHRVTVDGEGAEQIITQYNSSDTMTIGKQYEKITLKSFGTAWLVEYMPGMGTPVGVISSYHKSFTGVTGLPSNFVEMNGQTISDSESPLDGQTLENLNGGGRFLRGSATSGTMQNSTSLISHTANTGPHPPIIKNHDGYDGSLNPVNHANATGSGARSYYKIRPVNMSVVLVMRIK